MRTLQRRVLVHLVHTLLLGLVLTNLMGCKRVKSPLGTVVDEFRVGEHTFPVLTRSINGVQVRYVLGLVDLSTNKDVTLEQLQPVIAQFSGEILDYFEVEKLRELNVLLKIPFSYDPFKVADELNDSPLIRHAGPVFLCEPDGP